MKKLIKIKLDKIPYIFKNVNLPYEVALSCNIVPKEGAFVAVKILESEGKKDVFDYSSGRLGKVVQGDIIAGVLAYRSALVEFAGIVPKKVSVGDQLHLLCEGGLLGELSGVYESWGKPIACEVLGAIVNEKGENLFLKDHILPLPENKITNVPVVGLLGTKMDCGKTTMACKIINHYAKRKGLKVVAVKFTGSAFSQDLYKLKEHGANPVLDYVDMGYPSTCGPDASNIVISAEKLLHHAKAENPDLIIAEFGDAIIGKYHVADILRNEEILKQISCFILAASDLVSVSGAKDILKNYGIMIDLVTGPVVNSEAGVSAVSEYFGLAGESNLHEIPETIAFLDKKISEHKIIHRNKEVEELKGATTSRLLESNLLYV